MRIRPRLGLGSDRIRAHLVYLREEVARRVGQRALDEHRGLQQGELDHLEELLHAAAAARLVRVRVRVS